MLMINRRTFIAGAGAATAIGGFDPLRRRWVTAMEAADSPSFADAPPLDGALVMDKAARQAVAVDQGNFKHQTPSAVLRPGSVRDISAMIRYCGARNIPVSARGQGHTMFGDALSAGLVIENRKLNQIHSIGPDGADVDTGVLWRDLAAAAFEHKLRPPVLTGYTELTVGGTLSVGGVGGQTGGLDSGLQVDHVRRLEVVTGTGHVEDCTPERNDDLFNAVLAGLGQFGVMTRATVDLVPAKERVRIYLLRYQNSTTAFADLRTLLDRPGLDHVLLAAVPPGTADFAYQIRIVVFYDLAAPPDDSRIVAGLSAPHIVQDAGYLDYTFQGDAVIDHNRATLGWDRFVKSWFNVWLPASTVQRYVSEVVATLTHRDVGTTGSVGLFPQRRSRLTRPFLRLPEPDGSDWVFAFNILAAADSIDPGPSYVQDMLARNTRLFHSARDTHDGVLYPIGAVPLNQDDWRRQYGETWHSFALAKERFDPHHILGSGVGIFPR
jgi:FAD/FMN-containing dehydrogenase